jgi:hypothetical protein
LLHDAFVFCNRKHLTGADVTELRLRAGRPANIYHIGFRCQDGGNSVTVTLDRTSVYLKLKALPAKKLAVTVVPK